jgi:death-on-curing protein
MTQFYYLTLAEVLALHEAVMEKFGQGPAPLRSEGLLESAVMRARMASYYDNADLIRQCALLTVGISQAQAFMDGNKRTAFAAGDVFLRLNGLAFSGDPIELALQLEAVAERQGDLEGVTDHFEHWLCDHVSPLDPSDLPADR